MIPQRVACSRRQPLRQPHCGHAKHRACLPGQAPRLRAGALSSVMSQTQSTRSCLLPTLSRSWRCRYRCFWQSVSHWLSATLTSSHCPLRSTQIAPGATLQRGGGHGRAGALWLNELAVVLASLWADDVIGEIGGNDGAAQTSSPQIIFSGHARLGVRCQRRIASPAQAGVCTVRVLWAHFRRNARGWANEASDDLEPDIKKCYQGRKVQTIGMRTHSVYRHRWRARPTGAAAPRSDRRSAPR
jgi:hypothetical protein